MLDVTGELAVQSVPYNVADIFDPQFKNMMLPPGGPSQYDPAPDILPLLKQEIGVGETYAALLESFKERSTAGQIATGSQDILNVAPVIGFGPSPATIGRGIRAGAQAARPAIRRFGQRLSATAADEAGFVRLEGSNISEELAAAINGRIEGLETALAKPGRLPKGMGTRKEALEQLGRAKADSFQAEMIQANDDPAEMLRSVRRELDTATEELTARNRPFHAGKPALYPDIKIAELDGYAQGLDDFLQEMDASQVANQGLGDPNAPAIQLSEEIGDLSVPVPELEIDPSVPALLQAAEAHGINGEEALQLAKTYALRDGDSRVGVHHAAEATQTLSQPPAAEVAPRTAVQGGFGIGEPAQQVGLDIGGRGSSAKPLIPPEQAAAQGERARLLREGQQGLDFDPAAAVQVGQDFDPAAAVQVGQDFARTNPEEAARVVRMTAEELRVGIANTKNLIVARRGRGINVAPNERALSFMEERAALLGQQADTVPDAARASRTSVSVDGVGRPDLARQIDDINIGDVDIRDSVRGESFGTKALTDSDGNVLASVDVSVLPDEVHIQNITTAVGARRQGHASALVDDLFREFPNRKITISSTTDQGAAFFKERYIIDGDIISQKVVPAAPETAVVPPERPEAPLVAGGTPLEPPTVPPVATAAPVPPVGPIRPGDSLVGDFSGDFSQVVDVATQPDVWRRISNLPGVRTVLGSFNPSAVANKPVEQALAGRAVLREEGRQLSQAATARLNGIGTQDQVFGAITPQGLLKGGPLEALTVNTIRSNPSKYAAKTTPVMKEWIQAADDIERAKLVFLKANDIPVVELSFEEGGQYAGRRVWGKMTQGGEMLDSAFVGSGPGRPGARLASEKERVFKTAEDAIKEGYRYIPDDEALFLNVQGAYNRVADKRMTDWLLTKVDWRTTGAPEELKMAAAAANLKKRRAQLLIGALNRAVRGERITPQTINSIRGAFPEQADALDQLVPLLQGPNPQTAPAVQVLGQEAKGLLADAQADLGRAIEARARGGEKALATSFEESTVPAPAFSGKILTGPDARETARILNESLDPKFSQALHAVNQFNSVRRYFTLAGDLSTMGIQLLYLAGGNPKVYGKAVGGMARAIFDTRFQARYLAEPENMSIIQKYPTLLLSRGGATDFTEAMGRGGLLRRGPLKIAGKVLEPFQRAFEGSLDIAGIEMAKAYDYLGTTPKRIDELGQFINEFRGVTSSARLGVSLGHRQAETFSVLAPRYNRAIAALMFDTIHAGLRGDMARKSLGRGVGALIAMALAISAARGEDFEGMVDHITPGNSKFFTWEVAGQKIGPGTKIRSVVNLFAQSVKNPERLTEIGAFTWMRNPALRFLRGLTAPAIGDSLDLITGRDFIGDPTRDGFLNFSETVAKKFMPIWTQTVVLDGGDLAQRAIRGGSEGLGGRAYPVNVIWKLGGEWRRDLEAYYDIPTKKEDLEARKVPRKFVGGFNATVQPKNRTQYRKANPEIDAKLFITGRVSTLRSNQAKERAKRLLEENDVFAYHIPEDILKEYEDELGKDFMNRLKAAQGRGRAKGESRLTDLGGVVGKITDLGRQALDRLPIGGSEDQPPAVNPTLSPQGPFRAPPGTIWQEQPDGILHLVPQLTSPTPAPTRPAAPTPTTGAPASVVTSQWRAVVPLLQGPILLAVYQHWTTGKALTDGQLTRLKRVHAAQPLGEPDFDTWLRTTLRNAAPGMGTQPQRQPEATPPAQRELVRAGR